MLDTIESDVRAISEILSTCILYEQMEISCFYDPYELINCVESNGDFDIVLLSIMYDGIGLNGLTVSKKLKYKNHNSIIIFISMYDFYRDAINYEPFRYLTKPIQPVQLLEAVEDACNLVAIIKNERFFTFYNNGKPSTINIKNVLYFRSKKRLIYIFFSNRPPACFYGKLDNVEAQVLSVYPDIARLGKSCLVNCLYVRYYGKRFVYLHNGKILEIKPGYKKRAIEGLDRYKKLH